MCTAGCIFIRSPASNRIDLTRIHDGKTYTYTNTQSHSRRGLCSRLARTTFVQKPVELVSCPDTQTHDTLKQTHTHTDKLLFGRLRARVMVCVCVCILILDERAMLFCRSRGNRAQHIIGTIAAVLLYDSTMCRRRSCRRCRRVVESSLSSTTAAAAAATTGSSDDGHHRRHESVCVLCLCVYVFACVCVCVRANGVNSEEETFCLCVPPHCCCGSVARHYDYCAIRRRRRRRDFQEGEAFQSRLFGCRCPKN